MTYEAARSITGPYLALLGASGIIAVFTGSRRIGCTDLDNWAKQD